MYCSDWLPVIQRHSVILWEVSAVITVMHNAGFFLSNEDKLSNPQHELRVWKQSSPLAGASQWTESSIYRAGRLRVRSHTELLTAGGQVSESWQLRWRTGLITSKQALDANLWLSLFCQPFWVPGNVVGSSFSVRWKWRRGTENPVCVSGLPVVRLTGYGIGQQAPVCQLLGLTGIPFLLVKWKIVRAEAPWLPQWLSRD